MKKPNILFILTDDQAQWAVGAYGNKDIYTPNMDRLAEEGMLFTRAFTCPVCSPSRAMIMTGLYPNKVGVDDWISPEETEGISPDKPTIAEMLKRAGYITGLIGKWHLGKERLYHPLNRGFDYFMGFLGGGNYPKDPILEINGKEKEVKGFTIEIITKDAIRFIRENKDRPFALFFHTREPHMPYTPTPQEDMAHYINKKL
ncbi:sulfatase-like hydrolase/transferase, partial [bacterium]|nr:sulfatase-like hydrolase/transferase [bacterium]